MSEGFDLRSRFEEEGVFWDPLNPGQRFSAHLSSDPQRIELTTAAELAGPEKLFATPEQGKVSDMLHGQLVTYGPCTLIGLHHMGGGRGFLNTGGLVLSDRFRVSSCIVGFHLPN